MKSLLNWVGNKYRLVDELKSLEPNHSTYVEAFSGSASYLLNKEQIDYEILNDLDENVVHLWSMVKHHPTELIGRLRELDVSRLDFTKEKFIFLSKIWDNDVDRAVNYILLNKQSVLSDMNRLMVKNHGKININELCNRIVENSIRIKNVTIMNNDFYNLCKNYNNKDTFIFFDPPYRNFNDYRVGKFTDAQYEQIYDLMKTSSSKILFIINAHDNFIGDLFREFDCREVVYGRIKGGHRMDEIMYMNY